MKEYRRIIPVSILRTVPELVSFVMVPFALKSRLIFFESILTAKTNYSTDAYCLIQSTQINTHLILILLHLQQIPVVFPHLRLMRFLVPPSHILSTSLIKIFTIPRYNLFRAEVRDKIHCISKFPSVHAEVDLRNLGSNKP